MMGNIVGVFRRCVVVMMTVALSCGVVAAIDVLRDVPSTMAAGAQVSVNVEGGSLNPDGKTTVDLSGSGFQSVQGGFGGIYVLFGWVDDPDGGSWKPSQGGVTGQDYRYVPDDENNPAGYDVFVAFPGDSTASAANGGQIAANGTWNAKITVPGAKFTSYDRSNNPTDVDCTAVQCGIITIGAHGVVNASNETFTPLSFAAAQQSSDSGDSGTTDTTAESSTSDEDAAAKAKAAAEAKKKAAAEAAAKKKAAEEAKRKAASAAAQEQPRTAAEETTMSTQVPTLGIAGWLIVAAVIILGIAIIVLAAGVGGYLAMKSVLLGVSPAALDKEIAKRERKAEDVRAREAMKSAKRKRKQYERLLKEQGRADQVQSMVEDAPLPIPNAQRPDAGAQATQVIPPIEAGGAAAAAATDGAAAASTGAAVASAGGAATSGIRGFFTRHMNRTAESTDEGGER
ncbi:hypothetical protein KIH77_02645 [Bifidobacterium sp. 82T24]|uniref:hypothetical protein n=1 Tax=Bifidobacterium pluvialisilvae TaxID=2834436 RepID=UPI001C567B92|nr:hypothetical protein [Bifidobacterium pluvialisilvae]MBW3087641.1 hypothetical protein [Bifidobacterium pluvialisilvae]